MDWSILGEILILLTTALVLGTLAEQLRQNAIVGYLLAGAIVGPNVLGWVKSDENVHLIAELGIALLLFTIGLEFSVRHLRQLGPVALIGGTLQIVVTTFAVAGILLAMRFPINSAVAMGAVVALSSTATVLRLLRDRAALESPYGRSSMGILLLQDAAVLPLTLIISAMAAGGGAGEITWSLAKTVVFAALLVGAFYLVFNYLVPRLLNIRQWAANREFPILLAIVIAIGSAAAAQRVGVSPAIGAFLAGALLGESPFAVQIRADVVALRTVMVTIFFASVGMLSDPLWALTNWHIVGAALLAIIIGKTLIVTLLLIPLKLPIGMSLATGLCLAQVGEFSFVLAEIARGSLLSEDALRLIVAVTVMTLMLTPYLVALAPSAAAWIERRFRPAPETVLKRLEQRERGKEPRRLIIVIGFGPAGQRVAEALLAEHRCQLLVLDLNPRIAAVAERYGLPMRVGDASHPEVLESAGIREATGVVITTPEPSNSRQIIHLCREMNPAARVLVRARYHAFRWELELAGAEVVIDEEEQIGLRLADEVRRVLREEEPDAKPS